MKVAIVHDFLMQMGGAEKVVEVLHDMFPDAPIYTSAYDPEVMPPHFRGWDIRQSFLRRLPCKPISHRMALLLYPLAFESFDFSEYDLVISSSSAFAKGAITQPHTVHICYTHTPMRYAWMTQNYLDRENVWRPLRGLLASVFHRLRLWDATASCRVDEYIANSWIVARRIEKFYRRESRIVYPPVETSRFQIASDIGDYYLIAARFIPYKRLDLAIKACNQLRRPLKIVGSGRHGEELKAIAGPTVEFLGRVSDARLVDLMSHARAYIMPGEEDFGISPVEANACGRPVIAYAAGGALDSQLDGVTGVLFPEQTVESLCEAIECCEKLQFDPERIRAHAMRFDTRVFISEMREVIAEAMAKHRKSQLVNELRSIVVGEEPKLSAQLHGKQDVIER